MIVRSVKSIWQHIRYLPLWSVLTYSRWRRFDNRAKSLGAFFAWGLRWMPFARRKFNREIMQIFPDMPKTERDMLRHNMGRNMGKTLFEIYHNAEFQTRLDKFRVTGSGLAALEQARDAGKGAIIVSGHFGQWEAVRAVLKARDMETGGVFRKQANRHYHRRLKAGVEQGGLPALETGRKGTKDLVRHLRNGGFIAILLDEKTGDGERLPFLGQKALTSLAAARLALKYDIPMVPAFGTRDQNGAGITIDFEDPIPHTDACTMTQAFNDSLSERIMEKPDQWYWMLRRWNDA